MNNFWKISALGLAGVLVLSLLVNITLIKNYSSEEDSGSVKAPLEANTAIIKTVSAKEIYPLFKCPCPCGQSLQCVCGHAKEGKAYIDGLVEAKGSENEVILAYVKKYGLNSFLDEQKQEEFRQKLVKEAPADRPIISLTPDSYDFGDVSQKKGTVTTFFEIKNEGKSDLIIKKLETSCGCTTASVVFQEKEGPKFGMNMGQKIPKWQIVIPSGQTAKLKVYYDPNFHKKFKGAAIRTITVFSNDPIDFQKKVQIELNQTP